MPPDIFSSILSVSKRKLKIKYSKKKEKSRFSWKSFDQTFIFKIYHLASRKNQFQNPNDTLQIIIDISFNRIDALSNKVA